MKRQTISKRLVSFATALVMILSLWTVNVMAEDTVTFESISNGQLATAVVSDLTLGEGWTSTDETVISTTGKVKRHMTADKTVTIANATAGVSYDVTVLSRSKKVIAQSNFYEPTLLNNAEATSTQLTTTGVQNFTRPNTSDATSVVLEENGNQYLSLGYNVTGTNLTSSYNIDDSGDEIEITFKMRHPNPTNDGGLHRFYFYINLESAGETIQQRIIQIDRGSNVMRDDSGTNLGLQAGVGVNTFFNYYIKVNLKDGTYYIGTPSNKKGPYNLTVSKSTNSDLKLKNFAMERSGNGRKHGDFHMDDFLVTTAGDPSEIAYFDEITTESIANGQVADSIVSNLTLPTAGGMTWATSDPAVIEANGTVHRDLSEDKSVTLTATMGSETKTFAFTVKAKATEVLGQSNFYSPEALADSTVLHNALKGDGFQGWTAAQSSASDNSVILADSTGNQYIKFGTAVSLYRPKYIIDSSADEIALSWDMGFKCDDEEGACSGDVSGSWWLAYNLVFTKGDGTTYSKQIISWHNTSGGLYVGTTGGNGTFPGTRALTTAPELSVYVKVDLANGKYYLGNSADNMRATGYDLGISKATDANVKLTDIELVKHSSEYRNLGSVLMDNFTVTTDADADELIGTLSDQERADYFVGLIEASTITTEQPNLITKSLDLTAGYADCDLEKCNVSITWTSTNSAIAADGTVTQDSVAHSGKVMATVTAGEVTETIPYQFTVQPKSATSNVNALATNNFNSTTAGATESITLTNSESNSGNWTASSPTKVTMTYVEEGNGRGNVAKIENAAANAVRANIGYNGGMINRYSAGADIKLVRNADAPSVTFNYMVPGTGTATAGITFDLANRKITLPTKNTSYTFAMPQSVQEGEWMHVHFDINTMSKTYNVYVNGEKIGNVPVFSPASAISKGTAPIRGQQFQTSGGAGTIYVDNMYLRAFTDTDVVKTNAAVNAMAILYGYNDDSTNSMVELLRTTIDLPTAGPSNGSEWNSGDSYIKTNTVYWDPDYVFGSGATYNSIKVDGDTVNAGESYTVGHAGKRIATVSATSGSVTETLDFPINAAPVKMGITLGEDSSGVERYITSVTLTGATVNSGKLIIAKFGNATEAEPQELQDVEIYDVTSNTVDTSATKLQRGGGVDLKVFYVDSIDNMKPLAHTLRWGFTNGTQTFE